MQLLEYDKDLRTLELSGLCLKVLAGTGFQPQVITNY